MTAIGFDPIENALQAYKDGEFLVVMDDESRENEGDLIIAGCHSTTEKMAWITRPFRESGLICISLPGERLAELEIPMMVPKKNQDRHRTANTVSVDYKHGGQAVDPATLAALALSCHLLPLRARPGGVLTRRGHTETAVDLCRLTGLPEAGVLCELVNDLDGDIQGEFNTSKMSNYYQDG
ncbi:hypothetical protein K435DRAFT_819148 [Dendrothele bispora CBS 962.96]|uniref:3,4-dihydroxy-2-butanone-4-phosphate synthase n=1 Tax=Dendrothele bispora (strain CBS 962.96) TaxID=1314807 RepID=A0A4S8M704_DENBC|nr:hypothetical protein K435DRAFT_819148 [Dendrothele bispora CBS 962.96]